MFTWICPQCGREVPPAYSDCPDCAAKAAAAGSAPAEPLTPGAPATPQPVYAQPAPQVQVRPYVPPPPQPAHGLPVWLMTVLFAFAFLGLGVGIYWVVGYLRGGRGQGLAATVESPAAKPGAKTNPFQKYIEVSGLRFLEDAKKKTVAKFLLTNHSDADISGLAGNVTIWGRTQKSEEDAQGTFSFTANIGPQESKEVTAPVTTKFKIYELPDWQNVTLDLQITAPAVSAGSPVLQ